MKEFWDRYDKIAAESCKKNDYDLLVNYMEMAELAVNLLVKLEEKEAKLEEMDHLVELLENRDACRINHIGW